MVIVSPAGALVAIAPIAPTNILSGTARVTFWGALAMALTAGIGKVFGTVV
jgi:vacuolar iron transporter family protein